VEVETPVLEKIKRENAIWKPLPTGADACCIGEVLGASFVCVLWDHEAYSAYMHHGGNADRDHLSTSFYYPISLLWFDDEDSKEVAVTIVQKAFPRELVFQPTDLRTVSREEWFAVLSQQNKRDYVERGCGWDGSTDVTIAPLRHMVDSYGKTSGCPCCEAFAKPSITLKNTQEKYHNMECRRRLQDILITEEKHDDGVCRPIKDVGLPVFCVEPGSTKWAFPNLRHRLSQLSQPEGFWEIFDARYRTRGLGWRYLWDCVYVLEEAARRQFNTEARFLDSCQKIEHAVKTHRADRCLLFQVIPDYDVRFAERLEAMREGFPSLTRLSVAELLPLQLQSFLRDAPDVLRFFLENVGPDVHLAFMRRGAWVGTVENLNAARRRLLAASQTELQISVQGLQRLFAQVNNAELRAYYDSLSCEELRNHFSKSGISLRHDVKCSPAAMRERLVEVDEQWVKTRIVHPMDTEMQCLRRSSDLDQPIQELFGCMPKVQAKKLLRVECMGPETIDPHYPQVTPGRGIPKMRFRTKNKGLVPNKLMQRLLNETLQQKLTRERRERLLEAENASPGAIRFEAQVRFGSSPQVEAPSPDEERAHRRRVLAVLQEKWRPLAADGSRVVSLLMVCKNGFKVLEENCRQDIDMFEEDRFFADMLRKEQLYKSLHVFEHGDVCEGIALCRQLTLRVSDRRRRDDYISSLKKYETARGEALEGMQEATRNVPVFATIKKNPELTLALGQKYETMKSKALLRECKERRFSGIDSSASVAMLRKRLRTCDEQIDAHFPVDGYDLYDASTKRLRAIASSVGVAQGDQTHSELVENLAACQRRRVSAAQPVACAVAPNIDEAEGWSAGDEPFDA
jgi:hypothetical protein